MDPDAIGMMGYALFAAAFLGGLGVMIAAARADIRRIRKAQEVVKTLPPLTAELVKTTPRARPGVTWRLLALLLGPAFGTGLLILLIGAIVGAFERHSRDMWATGGMVTLGLTILMTIILPKPGHDMCPKCRKHMTYDRRDAGLILHCARGDAVWRAGAFPMRTA